MNERKDLNLKYTNIDDALEKVGRVVEFRGVDNLNRQINGLRELPGIERSDRAVAIGLRRREIRTRLTENARPLLLSKRDIANPKIPAEPESKEEIPQTEEIFAPELKVDVRKRSIVWFNAQEVEYREQALADQDFIVLRKLNEAGQEGLEPKIIAEIGRLHGEEGQNVAGNIITRLQLKRLLKTDKNIIENVGAARGQSARYRLNAQVEFEGLFDVDPEQVPGITNLERKLLSELRFASEENPISSTQAITAVYDFDTDIVRARDKFSVLVSGLRKKLGIAGVNLNNATPVGNSKQGGLYYLEKLETPKVEPSFQEAKAIIAANILELESQAQDDPIMETALLDARQAFVDLIDQQNMQDSGQPQNPTVEKEKIDTIDLTLKHTNGVRTDEETAVLSAVVNYLVNHQNLAWDVLHQDIANYLKTYVGLYSESQFITLLKPGVVDSIFTKALNKMQEENEVSAQRATWSRAERQLWENLQKIQKDSGGGKLSLLKEKISHKLADAFSDFIESGPDYKNVRSFQIKGK